MLFMLFMLMILKLIITPKVHVQANVVQRAIGQHSLRCTTLESAVQLLKRVLFAVPL